MDKLSKRLTLLREKQGWTKAETARRLGLKAPSTYGNWEYGIREPDLEMVAQIATLYDVSVDYLLGKNNKTEQETSEHNEFDIKKRLERLYVDLKQQEELTFDHKKLTPLALDYLTNQLKFMLDQTEKFNKY